MARKKAVARKAPATVEPNVVLELDGKKYQLAFTFGSLREAKMALRARGININLLQSFAYGAIDADTLPELFFATLRSHHPELGFDEVMALISPRNFPRIVDAVVATYLQSVTDPEAKLDQPGPPREPQS